MNDDELMLYSRQIMLPELDVTGQERLRQARALIIGLGGLGSPIALYLGAAGVGHLTLADDDTVDLSNLQRQLAHQREDLGTNKAASAAASIRAQNPHVAIEVVPHRLTDSALLQACTRADLVIDATDNHTSRCAINQACWQSKTVLVTGAAIGWEGHITAFDAGLDQGPCYQCLYPADSDVDLSCSENGVISPIVGVIGSLQALEAIKMLTGVGESMVGTVMFYDGKFAEWRRLSLSRSAHCPVCGDADQTVA